MQEPTKLSDIQKISNHFDMVLPLLSKDNQAIADIGCGNGSLALQIKNHHPERIVYAIECSEDKVQLLTKNKEFTSLIIQSGRGESLPFTDKSLSCLLFINSFHHIPIEKFSISKKEILRCLQEKGQLIVAEPMCFGKYYKLTSLIDDETSKRRAAQEFMNSLEQDNFKEVSKIFYKEKKTFENFKTFCQRYILINPDREKKLESRRVELEQIFIENKENFYQPLVLRVFESLNGH